VNKKKQKNFIHFHLFLSNKVSLLLSFQRKKTWLAFSLV